MRDRASTNNVAMDTVSIIYPKVVDIGCLSHTIGHVGDKFQTQLLSGFVTTWITLFSHSPKVKMLWKTLTGKSMPAYSNTRWWSKWEVIKHMMLYFEDMLKLLQENPEIGTSSRPKLLAVLEDGQQCALLKIEMAADIDVAEPFVKACYNLEGDGPLAFTAYEEILKLRAAITTAHLPNVNAVASKLTAMAIETPQSQAWVNHAKQCTFPGLEYFNRQLATNLSNSVSVFKTCQLFNPQKINALSPTADSIREAMVSLPLVSQADTDALQADTDALQADTDALQAELPAYMARSADLAAGFNPLKWWKTAREDLPSWASVASKCLLLQPSSAASERVFSILKRSFGEQQEAALQDYTEASLMLQYNHSE